MLRKLSKVKQTHDWRNSTLAPNMGAIKLSNNSKYYVAYCLVDKENSNICCKESNRTTCMSLHFDIAELH